MRETVRRTILYGALFFFFLAELKGYNEENPDSAGIEKTNSFFDTLQIKASNKRLTKELYEIVVSPQKKTVKETKKPEVRTDPYQIYNGYLIRKIQIKRIDIFGPEVYDTTLQTDNVIEKAANKFHINTSKKIIQNHLILKPGHYFNSNNLADNERILRALSSVNDARIVVSNVDSLNNTVDLLVILKDVWSKGFGFETSDFSKGRVDIWDRNFFGSGHDFTNYIIWNTGKPQKAGYQGVYKIKNMYGSFIDAEMNYISVFDHREYSVALSREFYTPETKVAGGLSYLKTQRNRYINAAYLNDTFNVAFDHTNLWIARSFPIQLNKFSVYRSNIVFSLAYNRFDYFRAPPTREDAFYSFQSRALILGAISFSIQNFYKTNFIYSFGRTEDIPVGMLASFKAGFEKNEFKDRCYSQLTFNTGFHLDHIGYLYNGIDLSSFSDMGGQAEQGAVQYRLNYFTELLKINRFRFRQFVKINFLKGFERYPEEEISLNNGYGIRGFRTDSIDYQKKIVANLEGVLFSPLYFYGFRFVFYSFMDIAFTGPTHLSSFSCPPYTGFGIGLRIRNDRLTFRTIQIQLGIYPQAPPDMDLFKAAMSGEPRLRPENFYVKEPEIFIFN